MFKLKDRRSVLLSWLVFGVSLLLVFVVVFGIIFGLSSNMYRKEFEGSNKYMREHIKMLMDNILDDTQRASTSLWLDNDMMQLFKMGDEPTDADYAYVNKIISKFNQIRTTNKTIESVFIVDADKNRVFSDSGITDMRTFYNVHFAASNRSFEEFCKIFNQPVSEMYFTSRIDNSYYKGLSSIAYVRRFGYGGQKTLTQSLIVTVNEESFINQMKLIKNIANGCEVYALDGEGKLMTSTGKELYRSIDLAALKGQSGTVTVTDSGSKYVVGYEKSAIGSWVYLVAHPETAYLMNIMFFQMILSLGFILIVVIAVLSFYRFFKKNYSSVFTLLSMLGKQPEKHSDLQENEFSVIENAISQMLNQNKSMDKQLYDQN